MFGKRAKNVQNQNAEFENDDFASDFTGDENLPEAEASWEGEPDQDMMDEAAGRPSRSVLAKVLPFAMVGVLAAGGGAYFYLNYMSPPPAGEATSDGEVASVPAPADAPAPEVIGAVGDPELAAVADPGATAVTPMSEATAETAPPKVGEGATDSELAAAPTDVETGIALTPATPAPDAAAAETAPADPALMASPITGDVVAAPVEEEAVASAATPDQAAAPVETAQTAAAAPEPAALPPEAPAPVTSQPAPEPAAAVVAPEPAPLDVLPVAQPDTPAPAATTSATEPAQSAAVPATASPAPSGADSEQVADLSERMGVIEHQIEDLTKAIDRVASSPPAPAVDPALSREIAALNSQIKALQAELSEVKKGAARSQAPAEPRPAASASPTPSPSVSEAPKPRAAAPAPQPQIRWTLRAAQSGEAWVSRTAQGELQNVKVGDSLPGVGRITDIRLRNGVWEVVGTRSTVRQ